MLLGTNHPWGNGHAAACGGMIMIGSTQLTYTKEKGQFHCPTCDRTEPYRLRRKREFLTVYFVPLVPLQLVREFVECDTCRESFDPGVQEQTMEEIREVQRQRTAAQIHRLLVMIVAADGMVTADELDVVRDFSRDHGLPDVTRADLLREVTTEAYEDMDWINHVRSVTRNMSEEDKELLVEQAFLAATAGGGLSDTRQSLLAGLPEASGMTEVRFREIISRTAELA